MCTNNMTNMARICSVKC